MHRPFGSVLYLAGLAGTLCAQEVTTPPVMPLPHGLEIRNVSAFAVYYSSTLSPADSFHVVAMLFHEALCVRAIGIVAELAMRRFHLR